MLPKSLVVCLLFCLTLVAAAAYAAQDDGDSEIAVSTSFAMESYKYKPESDGEEADDETTVKLQNFNLNFNYGYFFTAWHEAGFMLLVSNSSVEYDYGGDSESDPTVTTTWSPGLFYRFNIVSSPTVVPFIGANTGYVGGTTEYGSTTTTKSGYFIGGELGCKFFVSEKTSIFLSYLPLYQSMSVKDETESNTYDEMGESDGTETTETETDVSYLRNLAMIGLSAAF